MSTSYSNSGPIYLTQAQYDALSTKVAGQEYRIINNKQVEDIMTVVKLTDGTEIMSSILSRINAINAAGDHVLFDTSSIGSNLYLCSIFIDTTNSIVRINDLVTNKTYIGSYDASQTIQAAINAAVDGYYSLTVTATTQDGVTVTGVNVQLRDGNSSTSPVVETKAYSGQPVSFVVPRNFVYTITMDGTLSGHFAPNVPTGVITTNTSVTITYQDVSNVSTYEGIAAALTAGAGTALIGKEIADTWVDENGTSYSDPSICVSVETVEDEEGNTHTAAIMQKKYATKWSFNFDAAEKLAADSTTEPTALANTYYYGFDGTNYTLLSLSTGATIPYSDYTAIYKNSIRDTTCNIIRYGYNNWKESAARQYLNSDDSAGAWWTAQHVGDCAPNIATTARGWLAGCSAAYKAAAKPIKITCNSNTITDGGQLITTIDKIWLPSGTQMYGSVNASEGTYWPYWKSATGLDSPSNAANDGRKIYKISDHSSAVYAWCRSAYRGYSYFVWFVSASGALSYNYAYGSSCAAPACAIF